MNKYTVNIFRQQWIIHCALGALLGVALAGCVAMLIWQKSPEHITLTSRLLTMGGMILVGGLEGSILGFMQWRILTKKINALPARQWITVTTIVAMLSWTFGMIPFFLMEEQAVQTIPLQDKPLVAMLAVFAVGLVIGALFGLFQFIVLRHYIERALLWALANSLGWALALVWLYIAAILPDESAATIVKVVYGIAGGVFSGMTLGRITGLFLIPMLQKNGLF